MYLTEDLVEQIKENTSTEFAQSRFSLSTIIELCNQESIKRIRPVIAALQKEFFVITQAVALSQGDKHIRLPKRCSGRGLRECYLQIGNDRYHLTQITREVATDSESTSQGVPDSFYFEADSIVFNRPVDQSMTLYMAIEISPGKLTLSSNVTTVASVDFDSGVLVTAGTPTGFGTTTEYDFIQQLGYGNAVLGAGITPISASGTNYTFSASELPRTLKAGDYITLGGYTPVPNMPDEAVSTLIHAVSMRIYTLRGDFNAAKAESNELQNSILYMQEALADRIEGQRPVVKSTTGLLRSQRIRRLGYL
jgi:hypothetical protein